MPPRNRGVKLLAQVRRDGKSLDLTLDLREGWRRGDISWRATTWDLRRMGLGGMRLEELNDDDRRRVGLSGEAMALQVKHVSEYGEHAVAKRAGVKAEDFVVGFDDRDDRMTESDLLAYTVQRKRPGDEVAVTVVRDGGRRTLKIVLQ